MRISHKSDLSDEAFEAIVLRYISGEQELRDCIVLHLLNLASSIAGAFARRYPGHQDEFYSTAYGTLVEAVTRFPLVAHDAGIIPYVKVRVRSELRRSSHRLRPVNTHDRKAQRNAQKGGKQEQPQVWLIRNIELPVEAPLKVELRELLDIVCHDELDRQIMGLTLQDYTQVDISELTGKSQQTISSRLLQIKSRFEILWNRIHAQP